MLFSIILCFSKSKPSFFISRLIARAVLCGVTIFTSVSANAQDVSVATASNFSSTMGALIEEFEATQPYQVKVSYGSSGKLYAQIKHGAPYDLFFSADQVLPKELVRSGFAATSDTYTYSIGQLVLWSADPNMLDSKASRLLADDYKHLAIANPRFAPYGRAALEVLDGLGLTEKSRPKWVTGENVAQAYQYVHSGNAEMGFIALAQLQAQTALGSLGAFLGSYWLVPNTLYHPIKQDVVMLKSASNSSGAKKFYGFVRSELGVKIIEKYGYYVEAGSD